MVCVQYKAVFGPGIDKYIEFYVSRTDGSPPELEWSALHNKDYFPEDASVCTALPTDQDVLELTEFLEHHGVSQEEVLTYSNTLKALVEMVKNLHPDLVSTT